MRTTPIPVTVGTFEARRQHEGPKVTTVTRMEALQLQKRRQLRGWRPLTGLIPVTVGTFEAYHGGGVGGDTIGGGGKCRAQDHMGRCCVQSLGLGARV